MSENHARLSPGLVETIAGLSAGIASTLAVHPLDVLKTRLQIHRNVTTTPISSLTVLRSLINSRHPVQSLYRGLTPNLLGNATSWALFFYFKSTIESQLRLFHRQSFLPAVSSNDGYNNRNRRLSPADYFVSSLFSGILVTLSTNPIWVIKTRMLSTDAAAHGAYPSMWAGLKSVWQLEGLRGFYRGVGVSMVGVSHGAVQFAVYEPLKIGWLRYVVGKSEEDSNTTDTKLSTAATLTTSGTAKLIAGTVTYPYQVIRSRLQTYNAEERFGKGIREILGRMWREEGWRGFYRGVGPNVLKVLPATWVTFLVYENVRYYLPRWEP